MNETETCFDVPASRGPEILSLLVELDPLASAEPDERCYSDRVERFCQNIVWRRLTGDVTPQYIGLAIERMFSAPEMVDHIQLQVLEDFKYRVCKLFF